VHGPVSWFCIFIRCFNCEDGCESGICVDCLISSANAKKWEAELQTLRNNNARLTAALQESASNVDEWSRQLHLYKDENSRLRSQVL